MEKRLKNEKKLPKNGNAWRKMHFLQLGKLSFCLSFFCHLVENLSFFWSLWCNFLKNMAKYRNLFAKCQKNQTK